MAEQQDQTIRELGRAVLKLRGDLVFVPRTEDADCFYLVEDPANSRFYRIGLTEYAFVSLLDGQATLGDAMCELSSAMPYHGLTEDDAATICKWLIDENLAHTVESSEASVLATTAAEADQRAAVNRLNPIFIKVPIGNPNRFLERCMPWMGWIFSPIATVCWVAFVAFAVFRIVNNWHQFELSARGVFAPSNWICLAGCWIILKIIHEMSHGVVCKRYGGFVREWGLLFILFTPLAFVDVSSSWRFQSRWHRIHTAAAGMYTEVLVAAVATLIWCNSPSGFLNHTCYNIIIMASVTTILFNANPLMKFDGYYIVSDLLAIPNLYVNGSNCLRYWCRRYLLGVPATLPPRSRWKSAIIKIYGVASFVWRILVCIGLAIAANALLYGFGMILALIAVVLWLGVPTARFINYLIIGKPGEQPNRLRFACTFGVAATLLVALLVFLPWPGASQAPGVVEYAPHGIVRAASSGFVQAVHVQNGEIVKHGQSLVTLSNDELIRDVEDLKLKIKQSELRSRSYEHKGQLADQLAEMDNCESLQKRLAEKQAEVKQLSITAPLTGQIVASQLHNLVGRYVKKGDEILLIGSANRKELRLSIAQNEIDEFTNCVGESVRVRLPGRTTFDGRITDVTPRASKTPSHAVLCATNGGPLPVTPKTEIADKNDESVELLRPRFVGIVEVDKETSLKLSVGQIGTVSRRSFNKPIGLYFHEKITSYLREELHVN